MKFPRIHLFVDENCPALVSGKISLWAKPSAVAAMISTRNHQLSPAGARAAQSIRFWRSKHQRQMSETQIIIEGELMTNMATGLGDYLKDCIRFECEADLDQAEIYARLIDEFTDFEDSVRTAELAYESFRETLADTAPDLAYENTTLIQEIEALLHKQERSQLFTSLERLTERFSVNGARLENHLSKAA